MRSIGRYIILGLLGRGGMGAVYKAATARTGRVVAVKVLAPSQELAATADPEGLRRGFFREAALMARIRHPNVAQVLDVDEDAQSRPFFVMEYYCNNLGAQLGESYRVEEPTRRLGVQQSLSLARQLAGALARLHHEGILHRDVKPYNVMLADMPFDANCPGDEVKLIDFGLSRLRGEVEAGRPKGAVVGSPYYAAPEQETDPDSADERADVFSAGVTLFRCLTGQLPQGKLPASALRQGLDARFDDFFTRCCASDPAQRPTSARALLVELDGLAAHWSDLRSAACALPPEAAPLPPCASIGSLRDRPLRQPLRGARRAFGLDALWRPADCHALHQPERFRVLDAATVRDEATGLVWERGGSLYAVSFAGARDHAVRLATERFSGRGGWRLPTVEELCTLLLPEPDLRQLCLPGAFEPAQRRLWSADVKSFSAAWYADAEHGFVWWQDTTCEFFARCVTSEESTE
jgi:eukaryotic-like serine/threonine-protein kinase